MLVILLLLLRSASLLLSPVGHLCSEKEVVEQIFWCYKFSLATMKTWMVAASTPSLFLSFISLFVAYLIVYASFICICETSHRCIYFLECISCFRRWIFIWMYFHRPSLVCFFQVALWCGFFNTEHCIVIFAVQNFIANLDVILSEWSFIFNLCSWLWLCWSCGRCSFLRLRCCSTCRLFSQEV